MKRHEIIKIIYKFLGEKDLVISPTGDISREVFILGDSSRNFYMMGSMGLTSSIGLGLAICLPKKIVIVIDGDGSILMNLGSLTTIGHYAPRNLLHIVLDNEAYESTGSQPSVSSTANLDRVAKNVGYKIVKKIDSEKKLRDFLKKNKNLNNGPIFILAKVEKGGIYPNIPRVPYTPKKITNYFRKFIKEISKNKKV